MGSFKSNLNIQTERKWRKSWKPDPWQKRIKRGRTPGIKDSHFLIQAKLSHGESYFQCAKWKQDTTNKILQKEGKIFSNKQKLGWGCSSCTRLTNVPSYVVLKFNFM